MNEQTGSIQFFTDKLDTGTEIMRITRQGIWVNPNVSADEAARLVLQALDSQIKVLVHRVVEENEALTAANEQFGKRQKWWNERMFVLEEQRDALVEALKVLLNNNECLTGERLARAAIAAAEGEKT